MQPQLSKSITVTSGKSLPQTLLQIKQHMVYLLSRWKLILLVCMIGGLAGILKATLEKPQYEARLTFALEENKSGLSGALSLAAEFGLSLGNSGSGIFAGDNIVAILTSRKIIEEVLLSADVLNGKPVSIADYFAAVNRRGEKVSGSGRLDTISFPVGSDRRRFSYLQDSVLYTYFINISKSCLSVKRPDRKINLYEVKMVTPEERFSKIFTERLVERTTAYYTDLRTKRSKKTLNELERIVANMRGATKSAIQSRAIIQDANVNPAFAAQGAQLQQNQLDVSAYGTAYTELFKNLELARYQYLQDIPLLEIIDQPNYPMKRLKSGRLMTGLAFAFVLGFITVLWLSVRHILNYAPESEPIVINKES